MPRGAAGSLRDAAAASDADTFVVADGTAIPTAELRDLLMAHHASGAAVTVVVHSEPGRNGNPCCAGAERNVRVQPPGSRSGARPWLL